MQGDQLEQLLNDLPRVAALIKDRPYRQTWRFEFAGRPYYLKFYPHGGWKEGVLRWFRRSKAWREFEGLRALQRAGVPSARAVATLYGFAINGVKGDAVITEGIEPSIQLDKYLNQRELAGETPPNHRQLAGQIVDILVKLGRGRLGHSDLHLGNILLKDGKLHLVDGDAVHNQGLRLADVLLQALSAQAYATRTDLARAWKQLELAGPLPAHNARAPRVYRRLLDRAFKHDRYFGHLSCGPWSGHVFRRYKFPHRWSAVSRMDIAQEEWERLFPTLLERLESDEFDVIKRSRSGDVLAGEIVLGGRPVSVIIKRPRRKHWRRYVTEMWFGTRARQAWTNAWQLIVRNIPTAWPLIMMEKRRCGYVTDGLIVFERIPGRTLACVDCWKDRPDDYRLLLHRCGRLLRWMEASGLYFYDSKVTNWIVREDEKLGPMPMLVDVESIRSLNVGGGITRLIRSFRETPGLRLDEGDAAALLRGYAPFATREEIGKLLEAGR